MIDPNPQPQMSNTSSPSVFYNPETENLVKAVLGDDDLLEILEHEWKGEQIEYKDREAIWVKKKNPVIENPHAIDMIIKILKMCGLSKIHKITYLREDQIEQRLLTFECKLADLLALKRKEWNLTTNERDMIYHMIISMVESATYVSVEGHLMKVLRTTYSHSEYRDTTQQSSDPIMRNPFSRGVSS